jgi:hypothetical protein
VIRQPYPIAPAWQGKLMVYDVLAEAGYPEGPGRLLREHGGKPVRKPTSELLEAAKTVGLLVVGAVRLSGGGASAEFRLPDNVATSIPAGVTTDVRVLYEYERPSRGFPVVTSARNQSLNSS